MSVQLDEPRTAVTIKDVLLRAADILSEFDWRQGSPGSRAEGSMCAVGAIFEASRDLGVHMLNVELEACHINGRADYPSGLFPLAVWNDKPGRTKDEVIARLREAAE